MEWSEFTRFIAVEDQRLLAHYGYVDTEKRILARTVKLTEEVGELCEEVLSHCAFQRREKLEGKDKDNLPGEFADVVIVAFLLAKTMDVDMVQALSDKMEKIKTRHYDKA